MSKIKTDIELKTDDWENAITGIGKTRDKTQYTEFGTFNYMDDSELSSLYGGNGLGKRIVDTVVNDMTRNWIVPNIEHDQWDNEDLIYKELSKIKAQKAFNTALKWKRLFGGSIIIIGVNDGRMIDEPIGKVKGINWLKVFERERVDLQLSEINADPNSPNFGKVEKYYIREDGRTILKILTMKKQLYSKFRIKNYICITIIGCIN